MPVLSQPSSEPKTEISLSLRYSSSAALRRENKQFQKNEGKLALFFHWERKSDLAGTVFFLAQVRQRIHVTRNGMSKIIKNKQLLGKFESSRALLIVAQINLL